MADESWAVLLAKVAELRTRGDRELADEGYATLFDVAVAAGDGEPIPAILMARARLWQLWGRNEEAAELAELAREVGTRCSDLVSSARAVNLLGVMSVEREEWDDARQHFEEALERAYEVRNDELVGAVATNLGAISNIRGSLRGARLYYLESLGSNVRADSRAQLVGTYNNLGMVCSDADESMEALVYFGRAIEIAEEERDVHLLALLYVNQAEPLIETGDLDLALSSLDRAVAIARQLGNISVQADASRFEGRIARIQGRWRDAEQALGESLRLAREADLELHEAEALEELAVLFVELQAFDEARRILAEARKRYEEVGAVRDLERVSRREKELFVAH